MLAIALLILGIITRFIVHIPNFTPIIAIALFGGVYLKRTQALILPLLALIISDIFIGWHNTIAFTWGSIILISCVGLWLRNHKRTSSIFGASLFSSILFFFITNLGVWLAGGLYPLTIEGLRDCFILALPFYKETLLSSLLYTIVLFGGYEFIAARVKNTRFATVL